MGSCPQPVDGECDGLGDDTRLFYDLTAERTADEWYPNEVLMPTIRAFLALLPQRPRVLDLGCGPGYESKRLASAGAEVVGVDFSAESIRIARQRTPECRFEVLDFRTLDDRLGRFDGVFAAGSLIHVRPEELPGVLERIARVLNAGGHVMAIVRDGTGMRESHPVVAGRELTRTVYLYTADQLAAATPRLEYVGTAYLDPELADHGWRCHVLCVAGDE